MAYNLPCAFTQGPPPFFNNDMANLQFNAQDDLMDIPTSWMENIDPLLLRSCGPDLQQSWHQNQQQPLQRFMGETERNFFTTPSLPNIPQSFPCGLGIPSAPMSTLPQATRRQMGSPAPSHDLASTCSSARSPGADNEWYHDNGYYSSNADDYALPSTTSHFSQGLPDLWAGPSPRPAFPQISGYNCVNMSQVQVVADPLEVSFDADEGYIEIEVKDGYAVEADCQHMKTEGGDPYRYPSDEGIGASIKDEPSPHIIGSAQSDLNENSDADAEGDDIEDIIITEPASDTEYAPTEYSIKSTRSTRKRRASKATSPLAIKHGRVVKSHPKTNGRLVCKSCEHAPFKDTATLQRHIASIHTRAFICVFDFAGCQSTFASKNEWKRHVSSQHLNLHSWVCELGACAKTQTRATRDGEVILKGGEFNRKDLFTQHLRRMHVPAVVKRQNKKNAEWEEKIKELQVSCLIVKRQPPTCLACPLRECDSMFDGIGCWDERMEHVGKHLEKASAKDGCVVRQADDSLLVAWALRESIIERRAGGGYKLCGAGASRGDDQDAECEDE